MASALESIEIEDDSVRSKTVRRRFGDGTESRAAFKARLDRMGLWRQALRYYEKSRKRELDAGAKASEATKNAWKQTAYRFRAGFEFPHSEYGPAVKEDGSRGIGPKGKVAIEEEPDFRRAMTWVLQTHGLPDSRAGEPPNQLAIAWRDVIRNDPAAKKALFGTLAAKMALAQDAAGERERLFVDRGEAAIELISRLIRGMDKIGAVTIEDIDVDYSTFGGIDSPDVAAAREEGALPILPSCPEDAAGEP